MKRNIRIRLKSIDFYQGGSLKEAPNLPVLARFLEPYGGLVELDPSGDFRLTERGRIAYGRMNYPLSEVGTVSEFLSFVHELAESYAEDVRSKLQDLLESPATSESQKRVTRQLLGLSANSPAPVISLAEVRSRKAGSL